jgi:phosphonate transport system ATP-binding protein
MHKGRIVFDDEPFKLTPEVVRDVYGAEQELDESVTSTSIAKQRAEIDQALAEVKMAS